MSNPYSVSALRRNAWNLLSGKLISALLSFAILIVLVRVLSIKEYGAYVAFIATIEMAYAVAQLGLTWMSARYLPEYRLKASKNQMVRFCFRVSMLHLMAVSALAILFAFSVKYYLAWSNLEMFLLPAYGVIGIFVFEAMARSVCESLLEPLLLQAYIRLSMVLRQAFFLAGLAVIYYSGTITLFDVVIIELFAALIAMTLALFGLYNFIRGFKPADAASEFTEVGFAKQWQVARQMYFAHLLTLTYSPQLIVNFIQKFLGAEATAVFGFIRTLGNQITRYLPATLLFSLIRPKMVATFVDGKGMGKICDIANLVGKLSLVVLLPAVVITAIVGDKVIALLSDDKFIDTGFLFFGYLCLLIPLSQRRLLETLAVTVGCSKICQQAAYSGLLVLPCLLLLLEFGFGLWAPIIAIGLGYTMFNLIVLAGLNKQDGFAYDFKGFSLLFTAFALCLLISSFIYKIPFVTQISLVWSLAVVVVYASLLFLILLFLFKPLNVNDIHRLKTLARR